MGQEIERLSTREWTPPWVRHQHFARYYWAAQFANGAVVADAACGTGYGTAILASAGAVCVDGYDLAPEAVEEAGKLYRAVNATFRVADVRDLPVPAARYDVFVSFETVEHVERPADYLLEVQRVLRPDGLFLCSTPHRCLTNPGISINTKPFNRFHYREYLAQEFETELAPYFGSVSLYCQSLYSPGYVRFLNRIGRSSPKVAFRLHQARKLFGIPWESRARHWPHPIPRHEVPEMLIAVCRK